MRGVITLGPAHRQEIMRGVITLGPAWRIAAPVVAWQVCFLLALAQSGLECRRPLEHEEDVETDTGTHHLGGAPARM